jgi:hypothetical protein
MSRQFVLILATLGLVAFANSASAQETPLPAVIPLEFEVTFARWTQAKDTEAPAADKMDLSALEKSGQLSVMQRMKLTTLSELPATFHLGENVAEVTGAALARGVVVAAP